MMRSLSLLAATLAAPALANVELGGCYDSSSNSVRCALNSSYCEDDGTMWLTPNVVQTDIYYGSPCTCDETPVGSCYDVQQTHVATCHLHEDQCPVYSDGSTHYWISHDYTFADGSTCTCGYNRNAGDTQFGVCYDTSSHQTTCSVSDHDCTSSETWIAPQEALLSYDIDCPCDDVETGACYSLSTHATTCAVAPDSCDSGETFIGARSARDDYNMSCKLCTRYSPSPSLTQAPSLAPTVQKPQTPQVSMGACYETTSRALTCAFNSSYCNEGEDWLTPHMVQTYNDWADDGADSVSGCTCDDTPVGACYDYVGARHSRARAPRASAGLR